MDHWCGIDKCRGTKVFKKSDINTLLVEVSLKHWWWL